MKAIFEIILLTDLSLKKLLSDRIDTMQILGNDIFSYEVFQHFARDT